MRAAAILGAMGIIASLVVALQRLRRDEIEDQSINKGKERHEEVEDITPKRKIAFKALQIKVAMFLP